VPQKSGQGQLSGCTATFMVLDRHWQHSRKAPGISANSKTAQRIASGVSTALINAASAGGKRRAHSVLCALCSSANYVPGRLLF